MILFLLIPVFIFLIISRNPPISCAARASHYISFVSTHVYKLSSAEYLLPFVDLISPFTSLPPLREQAPHYCTCPGHIHTRLLRERDSLLIDTPYLTSQCAYNV
ncbi:hypothetical protein C8Q74DRAFT_711552 [Fomes fomentarius]|nr:hypothetical protein C8Q74DRAFT_711552 [Fomes fomentarius]